MGRCWGKTTSPELDWWYPEPEDSEQVRKHKTNRAKAVCYACPVKEECLKYAIDTPEVYGIWGGQTSRERAALIKRQWIASQPR